MSNQNKRMKIKKLSIVIPVYNGAKTITHVTEDCINYLSSSQDLEIVLVNDGSRDDSIKVCKQLVRKHPKRIIFVNLSKNFGEHAAVLAGISQTSGEAVAILGPSGCGKSTLVRGIVGILSPLSGSVRVDGAALDQWDSEELGRHIGYVPQNVELLAGTIAQNIARFEPNAPSDVIIAAARQAGVHDLILHLPDGYETQVGNDGSRLSAGQRQRIALARALYRDPFLIILDEPNSNLDIVGEEALGEAVSAASARGAIVIVVAHRPSILQAVDIVLLMRDGRVQAYGPKEKLVPHLLPKSLIQN